MREPRIARFMERMNPTRCASCGWSHAWGGWAHRDGSFPIGHLLGDFTWMNYPPRALVRLVEVGEWLCSECVVMLSTAKTMDHEPCFFADCWEWIPLPVPYGLNVIRSGILGGPGSKWPEP